MTVPPPHFIALAGNPNAGKTTAFNRYTGARQHVGNYPGITVEKKEGTAHLDGSPITLVDLPGTYSLTAYSMEEMVARRVLAEERPGAVIDVINAAVLERNMYLAVQLREMGIPLVLALNMMDEARAQGMVIDVTALEALTGLTVVPMVARTGEGLESALRAAVQLAAGQAGKPWEPLEISYGTDIDEVLQGMIPLVEKENPLAGMYPARWIALKFLERDEDIVARVEAEAPALSEILRGMADKVARHLETTLKTYPEAVIADYRYGYIASILRRGVISGEDDLKTRIAYSDKMDTVLTNRFFGPLILLGVLFAMYGITFGLGQYPADWLEALFGILKRAVEIHMAEGPLRSMLASGVIDGAGGVMSFVPLIAVMFLLIAFLEDSGYMARVSYMMDRVFRVFGLHGASVMPFIISGGLGGGCAIPGILATRTLRSPRERLATILTAPFMSCGAKLPVFLLLVSVFFQEHQTLVMVLLTLAGWVAALLVARLLRSTIIRGEATPFVMELPPYRLPTLTGILLHTWERVWSYVKKAGTIILAVSILFWAAMTYPGLPEDRAAEFDRRQAVLAMQLEERATGISPGGIVSEAVLRDELTALGNQRAGETLRASAAGRIGTAVEALSAPAGFDWRTDIALIAGIAAKELVLSTLGTAYSLGSADDGGGASLADSIRADPHWNKANGVALLLFILLYSPCFPTLAVIRSESGRWRWMFFSLFFNLLFAYGVAVTVNHTVRALM